MNPLTRKRLDQLYNVEKKTNAEISRLTGICRSGISKRIKKYGFHHRFSDGHRAKLSIARIGHPPSNKGKIGIQTAWNKGLKGYLGGESHYRWIADRTTLIKKQQRNDYAYVAWRKSVRDRDGWKCRMSNSDCLGKVVAHHILPWAKFPELRYEINNGITLCRFHHPRKRDDEMKLSPYFQSILGVKLD